MYLQSPINTQRIYDGSENGIEDEFCFTTNEGTEFRFTIHHFLPFPLNTLRNQVSDSEFRELIDSLSAQQGKGIVETFTNANGLELYYLPVHTINSSNHLLVVVSFGEVNPSRFQLNIEGLFREK